MRRKAAKKKIRIPNLQAIVFRLWVPGIEVLRKECTQEVLNIEGIKKVTQ